MERLMRLLDNAMVEMAKSTASQKAYDYLSQAMSIIERSYYTSELVDDERQMELDFNDPAYVGEFDD